MAFETVNEQGYPAPEAETPKDELARLRVEIDGVNDEIWAHVRAIWEIVNTRRRPCSDRIGELKDQLGMPVVDREREYAVRSNIIERCNEDGVPVDLGLGVMDPVIWDATNRQFSKNRGSSLDQA